MQKVELRKLLPLLNGPRLGSFGEMVFAEVAQTSMNVQIKSQHDNRADFLMDGKRVDVKTTAQKIDRKNDSLKRYNGRRIEGVNYARVEFFLEGARISLDGEFIDLVNWKTLTNIWLKWEEGRERLPMANYEAIKNQMVAPIKNEIREFFQNKDIQTRIIYRTCQEQFGIESPDNLIPRIKKSGRITIFLDFENNLISRDNLRIVYAYPESESETLPTLKKTNLPGTHGPGVDLKKIQQKFKFRHVDDLKENYKKMFS